MAQTSNEQGNSISHQHQPIMLIRSDSYHPYQAVNPPSFTATTLSKESGNQGAPMDHTCSSASLSMGQQSRGKRKRNALDDDSTNEENPPTPMRDHSTVLQHETNKNDTDDLVEKEDSSQESDDQHSSTSSSSSSSLEQKKPGRKPMADDEASDDDDDPKVKRKAQNRVAQRNFRERKERYVKELESKLKQAQDTHSMTTTQLYQENHHLRSIICRLENENVVLKSIHIQHGPLSGKPAQEWIQALHHHQLANDPLAPFMAASPSTSSSSSTSSVTAGQTPVLVPLLPTSVSRSTPPPTVYQQPTPCPSSTGSPSSAAGQASTTAPSTSVKQQQQQMQYTFSISTPATLRTRQKRQQHRSSTPSSPSPSSPPPSSSKQKHQLSPIELVRLYPHEHTTPLASQPTSSPSSSPTMIHSGSSRHPHSPASSSAAASPPPTLGCQVFCDKLQEEVCTNAFDQLLSEPLFDTTGGLNETLGLPHLNDKHPLIRIAQQPGFLSGQEVWDRLRRHTHFNHYSSTQLITMVKSMAKCTHLGPVLTEQDLNVVLTKMDQDRL